MATAIAVTSAIGAAHWAFIFMRAEQDDQRQDRQRRDDRRQPERVRDRIEVLGVDSPSSSLEGGVTLPRIARARQYQGTHQGLHGRELSVT